MDYGPPIQLRPGKGGALKIKRGGTGKVANSGTAPRRFHAANNGLRDPKGNKKHSHHGGRLLPRPPRGPVIWNPRDPFIIEYRKAHPVVEAAWRTRRGPVMVGLDIETINRATA